VLLAFLALVASGPESWGQRPPVIVVPPQSQLVLAGTNVTFSVGVYSQTAVTYQWYLSGQAIPGATTQTLLLTNVAVAQGGLYAVGVVNTYGSTNGTATLVVMGSVIQKPASVSLGPPITLNANVNVGAAVSYQWRYNGTNISGATRTYLALTNAQMTDVNAYSMMVSNIAGTLLLPAPLNIDPTFTKITSGPIVEEQNFFGGGATWGDYDNDGNIDLFVGQSGGIPNRLYHNNGDGSFTLVTNSAVGSILTDSTDTRGTVWGDYDNDGSLDLYVSNDGGVNFLYHNNGNGTFTRILTNGPIVTDRADSRGAVWGDFDNDGLLDLYVPHAMNDGGTGTKVLYHNDGNGTFSRVLAGNVTTDLAYSLGASWCDFNNDGLLDLFVANYPDQGSLAPRPNFLYLNLGNGTFQKITTGSIVTDLSGSVGPSWGDYDNDGYMDLFVANALNEGSGLVIPGENHNFLYHNNGDGTFTRITNSTVGAIVTDAAQGWDCAWGDYDNDGYLDLFVANPVGPQNYLYHNKRDGTFERITTGSLANDQALGSYGSASCTWGDYNNDGFLDLFAGNYAINGTPQVNYLYRNNGNSNGWLKLNLKGSVSNHSAIGAKVRVYATIWGKPVQQLREVSGGGGYRSQTGLIPHFGLGDATNIDKVRIEWPSGIVQEFANVAPRQKLDVPEQGVAVFPIVQNLAANSTFTAKTTFTGFISYQWQFNGMNLVNQTNSTLVISTPYTNNAGRYSVVITLLDGTVFSSSPALLRLPGPPVIRSQPQDQIVAAGTTVTLSMGVVPSTTPLSYQWTRNGALIDTHSSLVFTNVLPSSAGAYIVTLTNSAGASTSAVANLTVVSVTPTPVSVSIGASITLRGAYAGPLPSFLQWMQNGTNIPGANSTLFSITNVQLADASSYALQVTNATGSLTVPINLSVDPTFTKITSGVVVSATNGVCAWGDMNNDGNLDLVSFSGRVYLNNGDGTFSAPVGPAQYVDILTLGDFNNDGSLDALGWSYQNSPHVSLLKNNGDGSLTNIASPALNSEPSQPSSCTLADFDNDGLLDVFVGDGLGEPGSRLFRNNGGGTFSLVSASGLASVGFGTDGVVWSDYDNDGFPDVFLAGYPVFATNPPSPNLLYHNNGDGTFSRIANVAPGMEGGKSAGGCSWADYDNDGFPDLFVANGELYGQSVTTLNFLYHNNGDGTFTKITQGDLVSTPMASAGGFWGDYDNDGFLDLFVPNWGGSVCALFHNKGDGTFERILTGSLVNDGGSGGGGWADYDNDGFLDLVVNNGPTPRLYHNNRNANGWVKVQCRGVLSNRAAIGAKVRVNAFYRGANRKQLREIFDGDGWAETKPLLAHFGLGDATNIDLVRIEWPSGIVQDIPNVTPRQTLQVIEQGVAIFPRAQNLLLGSNFTFTAKATFAGPFNYQWSFAGTNLVNQTNATLLITNAQPANLGGYTVSITGPGVPGTVSSSPALLRVATPPLITASPKSQLVAAGTSPTLSVSVAPSATPLSYQWYFNGQPLTNGTGPIIRLTNVQLSQGGSYNVNVANLSGTVTGAVATINVVQVSPTPVSVSVGASARFTVGASGGGSLAFQWAYNGTSIGGKTSSLLDVTALQPGDDAAYSVVVSNSVGALRLPATINIDQTFTKITSSAIVGNHPTSPGVPNYPADCVWADFDGDGSLDLLATHSYNASLDLYLNDGKGNFSAVAQSNAPFSSLLIATATWADFNNDGYPDVLISAPGPGTVKLFRNNTNGTFTSVSGGQLTPLNAESPASGAMPAAWADYDNDGWLDVCVSTFLFRNKGDGTFTNVTTSTLGNYASSAQGGRVWGDYDNDGFPDLLIVNYPNSSPNILLHNNGDGSFSAGATFVPAANGISTYSCAWADYDNDGLLDLFVANGDPTKGNSLYHNDGNGVFTRSTNFDAISPINLDTYACAWGDYDNDGFLDLFLSNYGSSYNAARVVNLMFHNNGDGTFTRVLTGSPANDRDIAGGAFGSCSWADVNNDGSLDLYVASQTGNNLLYLNNGSSNNWVKVNCRGRISNAGAVGAKVRVKAFYRGASRWQLREISGGDGDDVSQPLLAHFGLGEATRIDVVRVEWPSGIVQELTNVSVNRSMNITEQGVAIYPRVQNLNVGSTNTFTAKTTFTNVLSYQWSFSGSILPDETNATLLIQNAQTTNLGAYTVAVTASDVSGPVSSSPALLRWRGLPLITSQPQDQLVALGSDVTLNVGVAPSATPLTYQWFHNSQPIPGATGSSVSLTNVAVSDGGNYNLVVVNSSGNVTNATAVVTVASVSTRPPSVSPGATVTLLVLWGGESPSFRWAHNGTNIPSATTGALTVPNIQPGEANAYSVVVSNSAGAITLAANIDIDPAFTKITTGPLVSAVMVTNFLTGDFWPGFGWADINNDGALDLLDWNVGLAYANPSASLYTNDGTGGFTLVLGTPFTSAFGQVAEGSWADFNNDGYPDLLVAGVGPAHLFKNNANGTFSGVSAGDLTTQAQQPLQGPGWPAWTDYDNDGLLDVFLNQWLYRNNGDGTFSNVTAATLGPKATNGQRAWGDYDNDGFPDLFMNTVGTFGQVYVYHNNGDGTFTQNVTLAPNKPFPPYAGGAWADYDNDGSLDLFMGNGNPVAGNFLYHNDGNGVFTRSTNFDAISPPNVDTYGVAWGDYDNDGFLDLFLSNAGYQTVNGSITNFLYHNNGDGTFTRVLRGSPVNEIGNFYSCSWADYNNDGFLDLYVASEAQNLLYLNRGNTNSWLKVKCVGKISNAAGVGAKVRVNAFYRGASRWQLREISGGDGDTVIQPLLAHFGLGDATHIDIVRIEWPSGIVQELTNVPMRQQLTVQEQGVAIYPRVQNLAVGSNATFTVKATLTGSLTYQWSFNGHALPGETNPSLVVANEQAANAGSYTVVVSGSGIQPVSSSPALLRLPGAPVIAVEPQNQTVSAGSDLTLSVQVVPSTTPLSYHWFMGGQPIGGVTGPTLVLTNVDFSAAGFYVVQIINSAGSTSSTIVQVTVVPAFRLTALPPVQGYFTLKVDAATGQVVVLQASTNLVQWQSILTNTAGNGTFNYLDPDSVLFNRRFYRGVIP
jgi:hypothetical protein